MMGRGAARGIGWTDPRRGNMPGRRRVIAATCPGCGEFRQGDAFNKSGHRECRSCQWSAERSRREQSRPGEHSRQVSAGVKRRNAASQDYAHKRWQPWTGPELEVALRDDLTLDEKARALGRTVHGVKKAIEKINGGNPRLSQLAGLGKGAP